MRNLPRSERPRPSDAHVREQAAERRRLREPPEGTTFNQFAQSAADETSQGRFASEGRPQVISATPIPKYPELPSGPWSGFDPVPDEPPLGYAINDQVPLDAPRQSPRRATGPASAAPSRNENSTDVEHAAPPPSSDDDGGPDAA